MYGSDVRVMYKRKRHTERAEKGTDLLTWNMVNCWLQTENGEMILLLNEDE